MVTESINSLTRRQLQAMVFLLVLPAVNWLFAVSALYDLGVRRKPTGKLKLIERKGLEAVI